MSRPLYHAPADCPVCGDELIVTRKGCVTCGTELAGEFSSCEFCALDRDDLDLLRVFLASRGNVKDVEKYLQVSYPTARARVDALLAKLNIHIDEPQRAAEEAPPDTTALSPRKQILNRLAHGEITSDIAARLIEALPDEE